MNFGIANRSSIDGMTIVGISLAIISFTMFNTPLWHKIFMGTLGGLFGIFGILITLEKIKIRNDEIR